MTVHGTRVNVRWPEVPTSHLSNELTVLWQVWRSETMQRLVHQHRQFEVDSLLHRQPMKLSEHWKRCGHVDEFQWRAVLPRSVPTAAVGSDRQRCHTAVRYSSLVGMTRMTKLASSWHRPTTNAQSFVHCSRPSDRLQWRGQTSLIQCQWPVPLYIVSVSFLWGDLRASDLKVECKAFLDIGAFFPIMSLLT